MRLLSPVLVLLIASLSASTRAQSTSSPFDSGGPLEPWPQGEAARPMLDRQHDATKSQSDRRAANPRRNQKQANAGAWVEGHVGLGAPIGNIGVALDLMPIRWFALNLGVGTSIDGRQVEITPRLRVWSPSERVTVAVGGGYSMGPYSWNNQHFNPGGGETGSPAYLEWDRAKWRHLEFSIEGKPIPWGWRFYVGRTWLLNGSDPDRCMDVRNVCSTTNDVTYVGFSLGLGVAQ